MNLHTNTWWCYKYGFGIHFHNQNKFSLPNFTTQLLRIYCIWMFLAGIFSYFDCNIWKYADSSDDNDETLNIHMMSMSHWNKKWRKEKRTRSKYKSIDWITFTRSWTLHIQMCSHFIQSTIVTMICCFVCWTIFLQLA